MDILLCVVKVVGGWVVLMFIGTNLIGVVVRGLFATPGTEQIESRLHPYISDEVTKYKRANIGITLFFGLLVVLYLYLLWHFWNLGVAAVAVMLILSRLPDLVWEIRTGRKVTGWVINSGAGPKGVVSFLATAMTWAALPLLWVFLC